jgi:hypothetical protein
MDLEDGMSPTAKGGRVNEIQGELERRLQHLEEALQRQDNAIIELKALLSRAADALEEGFGYRTLPRLRIKEQKLIAELREAANAELKANPDLNQTNVADLVWILDLAAEMFKASGETTWAERALRYKELFERQKE